MLRRGRASPRPPDLLQEGISAAAHPW
jgi:hypothetical protein